MKQLQRILTSVAVAVTLMFAAGAPPAQSRIPVIDVASLTQLVQSITYWQRQIQGMVSQITQLQQTYGAMTGARGFQNLLPIASAARNYLPGDWQQMVDVLNNVSARYSNVAHQVQGLIAANALLTPGRLAAFSPTQQALIVAARKNAAMLQVLSRNAQADTSARFTTLQQLIGAIGHATDQKAILELQGRIDAEQTMLTNEQNKMSALYQSAQAEELSRQQQVREDLVQSTGDSLALSTVAH